MQNLNGKIKTEDDPSQCDVAIRTVVIGGNCQSNSHDQQQSQKIILSPRVEFHRVVKIGTTNNDHHHHHQQNLNHHRRSSIDDLSSSDQQPQIIITRTQQQPTTLLQKSSSSSSSSTTASTTATTEIAHNHHVRVIKDGRFYEEPSPHQFTSNSQQNEISYHQNGKQHHHHHPHHPDQINERKYLVGRQVNVISAGNNDRESTGNVFRTPVVSSTSTPMRPPPPPPPPKIKSNTNNCVSSAGCNEEPSSSIPDLEFDGTTVLCRVCGDKASGFHYGVHSCEGCKGFFRRSIQQKIQYRPCTKNQQCSILRINRNRCQYCRLKKCIAVGMSRDAVRFGRVPKREKARILAAMQQSTQNRGQQRALATELDDQPRLLAAVLRAHMETCEFTKDKVDTMRQRARECPSYSMPTLACPLNPAPELQSEQEFSQRFAHVIRGVIDFAGMIPGFQLLTQDDKFTLLKAGLFDALFVRLICMFDNSINSIICLNGQVMRRDAIQNGANARFLVDSTFNFAERMNSMHLTDAEIGLFCAIVLITPDRPGLRNIELIEKMYSRLKGCLQSLITQNRPDQPDFLTELLKTLPDLRTLSTLHTEKLVVFRTEHKELLRQQMWSMEEESSKSPGSSSWGCDNSSMEDVAKSPMGSVSSTESGDISSDYGQSLTSSAPLLAATLSAGCPLRHRANSGSSADDDIVGTAHLTQNGLTITPVVRAVPPPQPQQQQQLHHHIRYRKLDSPTDSGIESGNEKADHKPASSGSSSCSSPRSSVEDANDEKKYVVEDMPVLKRVLQAPPLYDTNSLMDEAYKPHKKFRAMRHRDNEAAEAEPSRLTSTPPQPPTTTISAPSAAQIPQQSQLHMHLTRPQTTHHLHHLSNGHHPHHLNNNNINNNNNNNNNHHHHSSSASVAAVVQHQQQLSQPQQHHQSSSLSSTHSVLAKSLMEEPRMTPEQMKRSDIIQNYIMRESAADHHNSHHHHNGVGYKSPHHLQNGGGGGGGLLVCAAAAASPQTTVVQQCPYSASRWQAATNGGGSGAAAAAAAAAATSVITTTNRQQTPSPSSSDVTHHRYFQSPHSTSTSPPGPSPSSSTSSFSSASSSTSASSPRLLELQVDIADPQQPLNLSKKSPTPPPSSSSQLQQHHHHIQSPPPQPLSQPPSTVTIARNMTIVSPISNSATTSTTIVPSTNGPVPAHHKVLLEA